MNLHGPKYDTASLPYKVAVLCYLWDADGRILMLHRKKLPNVDMYSPVGGKVEISRGESPHECSVREVEEETGVRARILRFAGVMQYLVQGRNKVVCFWDMEAVGPGVAKDDGEVAEVRWVSRDEALRLLSHEQNRELLRHLPDPSI